MGEILSSCEDIEAKFYFMRAKYQEKVVNIKYAEGKKNVSDFLAKPLARVRPEQLKGMFMICK